MNPSIAISVGESSGDLNGAYLARAITQIIPQARLWGAGGPKMREAGVDIRVNMTNGGTIGIAETLKSLPAMVVKYNHLRHLLLKNRPDLFVPIDFGAFNIRLAQIAHANGIPVVYYFPPSSWRKELRNASKLLACGGKVVTPFAWSAELLTQAGVDARFVGHPLLDIVKPGTEREKFLDELSLDRSAITVGLLPGSRSHEIRGHLDPMLACAEAIRHKLGNVQFVIGAAWGAENLRMQIARSNVPDVKVVEGRTYDCMASSDLLIIASGTATLEAAILGVPMIIIYRGSALMRLEYFLRKSILEDFIGMPNIIAGRGICPELINDDVTPEKLAGVALDLLQHEKLVSDMRSGFEEVRRRLGEAGAVERAARTVLEMGELL
ncbi:MAG: lipid-A-disaccharide synthase [Armatimonadota bacterium]